MVSRCAVSARTATVRFEAPGGETGDLDSDAADR